MAYKLLDLYCGGGGASYGYEQAGFVIVGIDSAPHTHSAPLSNIAPHIPIHPLQSNHKVEYVPQISNN